MKQDESFFEKIYENQKEEFSNVLPKEETKDHEIINVDQRKAFDQLFIDISIEESKRKGFFENEALGEFQNNSESQKNQAFFFNNPSNLNEEMARNDDKKDEMSFEIIGKTEDNVNKEEGFENSFNLGEILSGCQLNASICKKSIFILIFILKRPFIYFSQTNRKEFNNE